MSYTNLLSDVATYLQANNLGTVGTDIFYGYMPQSPDACIAVLDGRGPAPDSYLPTQEPSMQIVVRSAEFVAGETNAQLIRNLLHRFTPGLIGSTYILFMLLTTEENHLGRDDVGRDLFSLNFQCRTR